MSALLTEAARSLGVPGASEAARTAVGGIAIAVLLAVLVVREMARGALSGERARRIAHVRLVIVPLSLVFLGVAGPRLADLMR
jgi:hypothetical protein